MADSGRSGASRSFKTALQSPSPTSQPGPKPSDAATRQAGKSARRARVPSDDTAEIRAAEVTEDTKEVEITPQPNDSNTPATTAEPSSDAAAETAEASTRSPLPIGPWLRSGGPMIISGAVHTVSLIALSLLVIQPKPAVRLQEVIAHVVDEPEIKDELKVELENQLTHVPDQTRQVFSTSLAISDIGASGPQGLISAPTMDKSLLEQVTNSEINIEGVFTDVPSSKRLIVEAPDGQIGDARAIVDSYQDALDRLTQEILWMLDKGPVLVVWLFDQSESMKDDQKEIRDRIEHVYAELGLISKANEGAIQTAIVSYGDEKNFRVHTKQPTHDRNLIMAAIDEVPLDKSGEEYMCSAVLQALAIHRPYAQRTRRQLALIIVTDESGNRNDNDINLERAVADAKAARSRVYVLGRESVFGYPYVHTRWPHPQTKRIHWLRMDRGPESAFVEQLQIDGYHRRYDAHPSGFGPYETTRLCRESGGVFFLLPSLEVNLVRGEKRKYDMQAPYFPDLRSRVEVKADIDRSTMRTALEKAIYDLNPYKEKMVELRVDGFAPQLDRLADQLRQESAKVPALLQYLAKAEESLAKLADVRKQEPSPRWQANYDLLHAQTIAYQARVHEYKAYVDEFLKDLQAYAKNPNDAKNKFKPPAPTKSPNLVHDDWHIRNRQQTMTPDKIKPYLERSSAMFKEVMANHPGTPWAARADAELKRGFGIELIPDYELPLPTTQTIPVPKY
jgi:hypothetical protein